MPLSISRDRQVLLQMACSGVEGARMMVGLKAMSDNRLDLWVFGEWQAAGSPLYDLTAQSSCDYVSMFGAFMLAMDRKVHQANAMLRDTTCCPSEPWR